MNTPDTDSSHRFQDLFEELKRRRVFRVATLYVLIFWPIIQIVDIMSAAIGLPDSAMRYLVLAFFAGLPVVLIVSWLFDLNRSGLVRDRGDGASGPALIGPQLELGIIAVMALVVAGLFYVQFTMEDGTPGPVVAGAAEPVTTAAGDSDAKSIAVLPFDTFSADDRDRFFADGLSEELLNVLAGIGDMEVAARTSSFAYRESRKGVPQIGRELGVNYVLEGSVRRNDVDNMIRVTAQLIDARTNTHVFSETFDRPFADVFAIQDEISAAVVDALKVTLLGDEVDQIRSHSSASPEAMIAYSMGQAELARRSQTSMKDAERFFRRALEEDPNYAAAWVGLADANTLQVSYKFEDKAAGLQEAREAVERAMALDPNLGMAWASQGLIDSHTGEDEKARAALAKAIELSPSYAMAHMWYAGLLEDPAQSFSHYERAYKLDPRSPVAAFNVASQYLMRGREAEAMDVFGQIIEADPNYARAYHLAASVSINRGRYADAIRQLETAYEIDAATETAYQLAYLNNQLQNFGTADEWAALAKPNEPRERLFLYDLLQLERHAMRGEMEAVNTIARKLAYPDDGLPESSIVAIVASYYLGDFDNAVALYDELDADMRRQQVGGDDGDVALAAGYSLVQAGRREEGEALLAETRAHDEQQVASGMGDAYSWFRLAQMNAMEGNNQMALINLQRATNEGWRDYWSPAIDPAFAGLRETQAMRNMLAGVRTEMELMRDQFAFERSFATVAADDDSDS